MPRRTIPPEGQSPPPEPAPAAPVRPMFGRLRVYIDLMVLACGVAALYNFRHPRQAPQEPAAGSERVTGNLAMPSTARRPRRRARAPESAMNVVAERLEVQPGESTGPHLTDVKRLGTAQLHKPQMERNERAPAAPPESRAGGPGAIALYDRKPIPKEYADLGRPDGAAEPRGRWGLPDYDAKSLVKIVIGVFCVLYFFLARALFRNLRMGKGGDRHYTND